MALYFVITWPLCVYWHMNIGWRVREKLPYICCFFGFDIPICVCLYSICFPSCLLWVIAAALRLSVCLSFCLSHFLNSFNKLPSSRVTHSLHLQTFLKCMHTDYIPYVQVFVSLYAHIYKSVWGRQVYCKVRSGRLHNEAAQRDGNAEETERQRKLMRSQVHFSEKYQSAACQRRQKSYMLLLAWQHSSTIFRL